MPPSDTPDVSVVVIVYNDEERLPRAVQSVLDQTLRNLEVIIADDCSTDGTEQVARALEASDSRVRYVRLAENSGGCSAPRNRGVEIARAPYLMFLDSDDELPRHACKSMLLVAEESGVDFVTGEVTRLFESNGRTALWYPHLFTEQRVVRGLREAPEYFFDHLSTNKLYRADFISRHDLRFPVGIHYEDQLFSAQAFTLADSFAVVPWEIYTWRMAPESVSISSSRHKIQNVVDRIEAARLVDAWLTDSGNADLRPDKDFKFLRHDFRLYLGDLPFRSPEWIAEFAEAVMPYLNQIGPEAYNKLRRDERVCLYLLRSGRLEEAALAGRMLDRPKISPRHLVSDGSSLFWGEAVPTDESSRRELDLSEWHLDEQVFSTGRLRHEIETFSADGPLLRMRIRTYDPSGLLDPEVTATLKLAASGAPLSVRLALDPDGDHQYVSEALIDLRRIPVGLAGIASRRHPLIIMRRGTKQRSDVLIAPYDLEAHRTTVTYRVLGTHHVLVEPENRAAGRLQITWERVGPLRAMEPLGPYVRATKKRISRVKRIVVGNEGKASVYDSLAKLPGKRELAVFEAQEGRGYTDNPRYIYEELRKRDLPIDVVWSYSGDKSSFPDDVTLVKRGSWEYGKALARAKYWVDSHNLPYLYGKPEGTRYLQTWHGQTLKMMGFDAPSLRMGPEDEKARFRAAVSRWDALVCPSAEFERTFVPAFEVSADLIRAGYPRNDVLVRWAEPAQQARAAEARAALEVPAGRKVLLYAPTFRDSGRGSGQSIRVDLRELVDAVGGEWLIVVRAHPYDRFRVPDELGHVIRDGASFADINDLLLVSDAVLTDYSSLMFDYANTGRPILLYTDDYEQYKNGERGTYYDLAEIAPGPMLTSTEELAAALRDLDGTAAEYAERYVRFQELFCSYETGQASKMVVDAFFEGGSND